MMQSGADKLFHYPYRRLADLLDGVEPGGPSGEAPILMHIGEPQGAPPDFVPQLISENAAGWSKYPSPRGETSYREAVADWAIQRYGLPDGFLDPERHITPAPGTREQLFMSGLIAVSKKRARLPAGIKPAIALPNPAYHVYYGAALMSEAEPLPVPAASAETNYLPDYTALSEEDAARLAIAYYCTPSNPTGGVATKAQIEAHLAHARLYGYILALDECYSEIYNESPPAGGIDAALSTYQAKSGAPGGTTDGSIHDPFANILIYNSLSKRSGAPGLRAGFVIGDAEMIEKISMLSGYGGSQIPNPLSAAATALWRDENHVVTNRALYQKLFQIADEELAGLPGYTKPAAGFFLWLDTRETVGDGAVAARKLWAEAGVKTLPGAFMSHPTDPTNAEDKTTPSDGFIRIALVHDPETVRTALCRIRRTLER